MIEGAITVIDEVGIERFNMRLLAERLGTGTATIYRHVSSKDELLVHVVDYLIAFTTAPERAPAPLPWQQEVQERCLALYRTLRAHHNLLPVLAGQIPIGPNALAAREQAIAGFVGHGFEPHVAARAYTTLAHFTLSNAADAAAADKNADAAPALGDYYRTLDPAKYPHTIAAAGALAETSPEQEFLEGLQLILDGISTAQQRGR